MSEEQIPEPTETESDIEVTAHSVSPGCIVNNSAALTEDDVVAHRALAEAAGCIVNNSAALTDEDVVAHAASTSGCVINNSAALTEDEPSL